MVLSLHGAELGRHSLFHGGSVATQHGRRVTTNMPIRRVIEETPFLVADEPVADSAAKKQGEIQVKENLPQKIWYLPSFLL